MGFVAILLNAVITSLGISMDSFAISVMNGISVINYNYPYIFFNSLMFGFFQGAMPLIGYLLGSSVGTAIDPFDTVLIVILLGYMSLRMIYNSVKGNLNEVEPSSSYLSIVAQAFITSLDSLVIGVSFITLKLSFSEIILYCSTISVVTFILCLSGIIGGRKFGKKLGIKAELVGGIVLLIITIKNIVNI